MSEKLIIANCSGFYGDRLSAAKEMVSGGRIDVLTGDYLAELTMAILFRKTLKNPDEGYAGTFLKQMEQVMGECLDKKIKIVTNAGGLSPKGLAKNLELLAESLGVNPKISYISGDNILPKLSCMKERGEKLAHLDNGKSLFDSVYSTVTANAYIGGWGITTALNEGADIVIAGRIADASLVSGPAAWKFGWSENSWDELAGAVAAGHIIECGTQATGGNYSFMDEVKNYSGIGFPIAEIYEDGSSVITKHPGTGGIVNCGTVKAQLLYEVKDAYYLTPDVTACFDTIDIEKVCDDRVIVKNTKGLPPSDRLKVCCNNMDGFKNSVKVILTGLDIEKKAEIIENSLFESLGGKEKFDQVNTVLQATSNYYPQSNDDAFSYLTIAVKGNDQKLVGKIFSSKCVELALSNIPGFSLTSLPGGAKPAIQHWPALISRKNVKETVHMPGNIEIDIKPVNDTRSEYKEKIFDTEDSKEYQDNLIKIPLGRICGTRSGDKGGNANIGVWARESSAWPFVKQFLTIEKLKELLPDLDDFEIERYEFSNLGALNFYIKGILGDGVASSLRNDPQGKTLGEYLRCIKIDVPSEIVDKTWLVYS